MALAKLSCCSRSSSRSTTSGDIFYCSGSRQLNHSRFRINLAELNSAYETYHTRILFFERYVHMLTYSILAYAYPRALPLPLHTLKIWGAGVYSPRSYGAEFVCFFCLSVTLLLGQLYTATSRVNIDHARHRKPRRSVYALNLGDGHKPPDKSPPGQKTPRTKALPDKNSSAKSAPGAKDPRGKSPPGKRPPGQKPPAPPAKSAQRRHILLQR